LRASLLAAITGDATRIEPSQWQKSNFVVRALMRSSYGMVRMLVNLLGQKSH